MTIPTPRRAATPAPERRRWRQLHLTYPDWRVAEAAALGHLLPLLDQPDHRFRIPGWWYVRKGPTWRVRLRMPFDPDEPTAQHLLDQIGSSLADRGPLQRWSTPIYEPETHAFGGPEAMAAAHTLFVADSRRVLAHLARTRQDTEPDLRRELALLLATQLLRGAGLEWSEQGDVWHRVATRRADPDRTPTAITPPLVEKVHRLLTADSASAASPLHRSPDWPAAFITAGARLAELAAAGRLTRGLRAVLTHHLLFGFNRLGIPAAHQYRLAAAAVHAVFGEDPMSPHPTPTTHYEAAREADRLRQDLADHIRRRGTFHTPAVEKAFRIVPRHAFLPDMPLSDAYAARPVVTRRDTDGSALSSASSPNLVAGMLELLDVAPGQRILEIGSATGINAALLAELTGPTGHVTTIEIDDDLAQGARDALARTGYPTVEVITGDGALGHPPTAPYDRIIVTAGAWDIPADWWQQLAPDGRIVIPLRLHASGLTRVLPLTRRDADTMVSTSALVCGFVPMRGSGEHDENMVRLSEDAILNVDADDHPDAHALTQTLTGAPLQRWTGIQLRDGQPVEHLDLWLATAARTSAFGRLSVGATSRANGIDPARRWAGAGIYRGGNLAYLILRDGDTVGTDAVDELGIAAHGPDARAVTDELAALLSHWDDERSGQPVVTATPTTTNAVARDSAAHMTRPHTTFSVTW